jgi:hypothetical protein
MFNSIVMNTLTMNFPLYKVKVQLFIPALLCDVLHQTIVSSTLLTFSIRKVCTFFFISMLKSFSNIPLSFNYSNVFSLFFNNNKQKTPTFIFCILIFSNIRKIFIILFLKKTIFFSTSKVKIF